LDLDVPSADDDVAKLRNALESCPHRDPGKLDGSVSAGTGMPVSKRFRWSDGLGEKINRVGPRAARRIFTSRPRSAVTGKLDFRREQLRESPRVAAVEPGWSAGNGCRSLCPRKCAGGCPDSGAMPVEESP